MTVVEERQHVITHIRVIDEEHVNQPAELALVPVLGVRNGFRF